METKFNFNSEDLQVKFTSDLHKDCELCCFNREPAAACDCCPLRDGFYFEHFDNDQPLKSSCMSLDDKKKLTSIIEDLDWLSNYLKSSLRLSVVFDSTIDLAKTSLSNSFSYLDKIKTFDS